MVVMRISEKMFMQQVIQIATLTGWMCFHVHDSRKSAGSGWPDLAFCGHGQFFMAELKSERGRVTPAQQGWIDALSRAGIEVHVWRPADFNAIVARLEARCAAASCYNEHKVTLALASRKDDQP